MNRCRQGRGDKLMEVYVWAWAAITAVLLFSGLSVCLYRIDDALWRTGASAVLLLLCLPPVFSAWLCVRDDAAVQQFNHDQNEQLVAHHRELVDAMLRDLAKDK